MLFTHLQFILAMLSLVAYIEITALGGAGDNNVVPGMMRCRDNERRALLNFKEGLVDEGGLLSSWGESKEDDCCKWRGIHCSNQTGHVTVIDIHGNSVSYVSGKVSSSLLGLNKLKYLDLSYNRFGMSPIPEFFGSLNGLEHLDLSVASFSGKVPHQLGNLTNLRYLDLGSNDYLTVDNLEWLYHLRLLRDLSLTNIDLSNSTDWLQLVYKFTFLTNLSLSWCNLPVPKPPLLVTNSSIPLAVVNLAYNFFKDPASYNWLFNISSLVHVYMSGNNIGRTIPEAFGRMASLELLSLTDCQLEGELPKSFTNLSRLATLHLQSNNFKGKLSDFLHPLSANKKNSLRDIDLAKNQLHGSMPDFTRFPLLRTMSIFDNKLSGSFPENFGLLFNLVYLDLSTNQITGSFPNITLLSSLETLVLENNQLEDSIPEAYLSNLTQLKYLALSFNRLSLNFSFDWVPPFQLDFIQLQSCNLGPHFPNWLRSQRNFSVLDISAAKISDTIPQWFWDLSPRLQLLNMSYNLIQGMLPDLSIFTDLERIDFRSNNLMGTIPSFPPNVTVLHLSRNMFTESVSFICTTEYKSLFSMDLSENKLSGELPDCWRNTEQLNILNLANNNLSGKIPTSVGLLNQLQILQLRNNKFIGELPSSMKNCVDLGLLDLSENTLAGKVPIWIGMLTGLRIISLRKNKFSGIVPPQICYLNNAQVVDLSQNSLFGSIPNCFNNLTSLVESENSYEAAINFEISTPPGSPRVMYATYIANALVQWKGRASEYKNTLGLLKLIDISSNRLFGKIPQEFSTLEGLISLNLSHNNLTGSILQNVGQMKMLEVLDLSRNQLSGKIPANLSSLTFLSVMDLSYNNFTGRIPSSTQLQSFNASVFAGNVELCGLPLPTKCPGDEKHIGPPVELDKDEKSEEREDKFVTMGFYVSLVLGFIVGFWGFCGPLLLRSTWRHAYFKFLGKIWDWIYLTTAVNMRKLQRKLGG